MKNPRALVMIGVSVVAALAAVWIAARWVSQETAIRTARIVVATTEVEIGSKLAAPMVRLAEWPVGSVPAGALTAESKVIDRVVLVALQKGEPVLESRLAPEGAKAGLSALVAKGKRAVSVKVNEVVGVAGFLSPGSYVDVMVNTQEEHAKGNEKDTSLSKIVLQRVLVLAVAQETSADTGKPRIVSAVTLELTPEEAENLDLARSVGTLSLALRNQVDQEAVRTAGANKSKLLNVPVKAAPAPVAYVAPPQQPPKRAIRKPAPAPQPVVAQPEPRACTIVLTGTSASRECF
jgi:pilus assembly protein CpaB